jgi:formamidopyrimidine-DNA glycosylase
MPELPEIETVRMQLARVAVGRRFTDVEMRGNKTVHGDITRIIGLQVRGVRRIAKVLLMDLDDDLTVAFHFKMTGQLILEQDDDNKTINDRVVGGHPTEDFVKPMPGSHTRVIFKLDKGTLYFNDQRMFGWVKVGKREEIENDKFIKKLGPEPFDMTEEEFKNRVGRYKKPIKIVLMEQEVLAGVGNIYANDALWEAKVNPRRPANTLTAKQYSELFKGLTRVLKEGIEYGGASYSDYVNAEGLGGKYQEHFRAYSREGEECLRNDGGVIHKFDLGGRGTYFCPKCQE